MWEWLQYMKYQKENIRYNLNYMFKGQQDKVSGGGDVNFCKILD